MSPRSVDSNQSSRLFKPLGVAALVIAFGISFLLGTDGFQTYLSKERRLLPGLVRPLEVSRDYRALRAAG